MEATVLFVEDNADTRRVLSRLIRSCGWNVMDFPDAEQALAAMPDAHVDLALLDIRLPGMWGDELAVRLRALQPNMPIAFVTAEPPDATENRLRDLPECTVIHKPIRVERFLDTLHHALARRPN